MAERKQGAKAPPTDHTIARADWCGRDLSGEAHERTLFTDLDCSEAMATGATFTECTFRRAKFNVSRFTDAAFVNCTFGDCNFFEVHFTGCKMVGSVFDRCSYDLMRVEGGNWSHVAMPRADLSRATFEGVRMREADLTGVRCVEGVLRHVDLSGAWFGAAKLAGCDLRGSDLTALDPREVELEGAIVTMHQAITIATAMGLDVRSE